MFYSESRLNNWIERIKEEKINIESGEGLEVFDRLLDDFIIASLNLLKSIRDREITKKEAMKLVQESKPILNKSYKFEDEVKNELFEITKDNMRVVLKALEYAIEGKKTKKSFEKLLEEAIKKERNGDIGGAFEDVAKMAAKALHGERLPEDLEIPDEDLFVVGWIDAVDAIDTINLLMEIDRSEVEDEQE